MTDYKCHNCPHTAKLPAGTKEWVCSNCGCVNVVPNFDGTASQACTCLAPPQWAGWDLPAGDHMDAIGRVWFKTASGTWLKEDDYTRQLGINPRIAQEAMRRLGREGVEGYFNCSTLGKRKR